MSKSNFFPESQDREKLEILSRALRSIQAPRTNDQGLVQTWYQGNEPYFDVFINYRLPRALDWIELTLRGKFVEWRSTNSQKSPQGTLRTGDTNEYEQGDWQPASKLLSFHDQVDPNIVAVAIQILSYHKNDSLLTTAKTQLEAAFCIS